MKTTAIFGPPGTGKTARLKDIANGFLSSGITDMAVLSFSKAAAMELTNRFHSLSVSPTFIGTIHALCFKTLQLIRPQVATVENFTEWYGGGNEDQIKQAMEIIGLSRRLEKPLIDIYSSLHSLFLSYEELCFIHELYHQWKKKFRVYDFDDMLERAIGKLPMFKIVIVDEAQDLSNMQMKVIQSIVKDYLYLAGDDDQAIYTWAGANPHGMIQAATVTEVLTQSYRLPKKIWEVANTTINTINNRVEKDYFPREEIGELFNVGEYNPYQIPIPHTVLCRDHFKMKEIEEELIAQAIPYRMEGIYGKGLLYGPWGKIIKAIQNQDLETLDKYKSRLPMSMQLDIDMGNIPSDWQVILPFVPSYCRNYFERIESYLDLDSIILSTIHGQKGKEYDNIVLMAHCSPVVDSLSETVITFDNEVRVWYTGITRAKKSLMIVGTNQYIQERRLENVR